MTTWDSNNKLTRDTELFEAIGKIRNESDKRREVEARVLAENNLASVRQLSEDKKKQFCAIVDAILAETADVNTQLFSDPTELTEAAAKVKMTPWTKQDHNPEKNSTFTGAPKTNPNKGGYAGGAKAEKTKHGYTAMRRIKEEEEGNLQEISKDLALRAHAKAAEVGSPRYIKKFTDADAEYMRSKRSVGGGGSGAPEGEAAAHETADRLRGHIRRKFGREAAARADRHDHRGNVAPEQAPAPKKKSFLGRLGLRKEDSDLQELSKDTLERYVDSATDSAERGRLAAGYATRHAAKLRSYKGKNQQARDEYERVAKKRDGEAAVALKHRDKRLAGVKLATKKLGEESDLQELSKKTLGSYIKKASHDITVKGAATREFANRSREDRKNDNFVGARKNAELSDKTFNKSWNRRKNMAKAVDRLTKEDMDSLEEMYLDIENFILESEGYDSIDRLNEQGQEKLAAIVENVMEEILSEEEEYDEDLDEETDLHELSDATLKRYRQKANVDKTIRTGRAKEYMRKQKDGYDTKMRHVENPNDRIHKVIDNKMAQSKAGFDKEFHKIRNRSKGIARSLGANLKYDMPEENDLQELSRRTMANYITKAHVSGLQAAADGENAYMTGAKKNAAKIRASNLTGEKREQGINRAARKLAKEETVEEGWFSGKKTPTPNPKGAPRGERDVGDYKNPTGHANKDVSQAVRNDRKLAKKNNGRLSGEGY